MLRVLFINYEYPPLGGGAANATRNILRQFSAAQDIEVDLVTSAVDSRYCRESLSANVTVHRLPVRKANLHYWRQREVASYLLKANGYIDSLSSAKHYDLAHAFFSVPSGMLSYRRRKDMPYIISLRGSDVPGFNRRLTVQYFAAKPLIRRVWTAASAVVANSEGLRSLALATSPEQEISVIPNGVDCRQFYCREGAREEKTTLELLAVSRLVGRKGIDILIAAMPHILETREARLTVVGEGNLEAALRKLAQRLGVADKVTFRGYVPHEELPAIYADADVFVLPSRSEGMSNSLLEAMASGLPVITSSTGGSAELVSDNGIVLEENTPACLAKAVVDLSARPDVMKTMAGASRRKAESLSWQAVAARYLDIYRSVAGEWASKHS